MPHVKTGQSTLVDCPVPNDFPLRIKDCQRNRPGTCYVTDSTPRRPLAQQARR